MSVYLQVDNISKSYGDKLLFSDVSFSINRGQKTGLIAGNGAGKTTMLNIIAGLDNPENGKIIVNKDINISYLRQNPDLNSENTVIEQVFSSSDKLVSAVKNYEKALEEENLKDIQKTSEQMDLLQAWDYERKIKQVLSILKIYDLNQSVSELSGGQKRRLSLANALINNPDFLIMDEPTNHLDFEMIEWLEEYLDKEKITLLLVTHDRYFLDKVCDYIIEISDETSYIYRGNYAYYLEKSSERRTKNIADVEKAKNLLRRESEWMNRMPQARATKAKYRIAGFYKLKDKASKNLSEKKLNLEIETQRLGKKILELFNINKSFDDKILVKDFSYKFSRNEKIGIVGVNGVGKSTFLNVITENIPPDSGTIEKGETVVYGYYKQETPIFEQGKKVIEIITDIAEYISLGTGKNLSASQFLEYFMFPVKMQYNFVEKLSGGEKRRLYLMTVLMKNPNFLIMDEPTNDLDIMTLNVLEDYLLNYSGCLIIVSHDRYFTDKVAGNLFVFEGNGIIRNFPGNYSSYKEYKKETEATQEKEIKKKNEPKKKSVNTSSKKKMSYKEKTEFEGLESEIENLSSVRETIETELNSGKLTTKDFTEKSKRLSELIEQIDEKEFRWLELSELV